MSTSMERIIWILFAVGAYYWGYFLAKKGTLIMTTLKLLKAHKKELEKHT